MGNDSIFNKDNIKTDLFASFAVFLIALPLCLGISIASGVDPIKGLITGIIGGVVVGIMSGAPLQISGPSAGLTVMVLHVVDVYGPQALVPLGIVVGLFQLFTAVFKVGHFFQATPPALLKAMLSGIGALILLSQFYIIFDLPMSSNGFKNLLGLPDVVLKIVSGDLTLSQVYSGLIGIIVIAILIVWNYGQWPLFEMLPGPLVSTVAAAAIVYFFEWEMNMISLPKNLFAEALSIIYSAAFEKVDLNFFVYAIGFAFVASAETLLCVSAIDKMAKKTSSYNKQIMAQGFGNLAAGLLSTIPVVGVISRSAANVEFGARTKLASILQGFWFGLFLLIPGVLGYIPIPALAGLLIFIGFKLLDIKHVFDYIKNYNKTSIIFFTTFFLTVFVDLLAGVLAGFAVSIFILVVDVLKYDLEIQEEGDNKVLKFTGKLSFLDLPVLSKKLQGQDLHDATNLEICLQEVEYLDPAINEHLSELKDKLEAQGKNIKIRYSKFNIH
ncbi:MAG: SulP family inorganic anion transporter [Pseudomonadota bacterium]